MAINVFDLYAKLGLDSSGYDKGLDVAKSAAKTAGVAIAASMTAAAAGAAALVKQSVSAYAEYEQLVGGVETLFSNLEGTVSAAPQVLENAANAYKTAGMSANQYMETVTSFSAALIAGLNNDYNEAARVSDMAITDMSDNANKMGTAIESIRTAYAGFAKQNYTMLDNLKLGYGGTKEEMQRLLDDAEKFSGVDYNISNLNDVYEAIHVIQTEMGITGTTAKEASETISGSIGMLSGAWTNLVAGFADKEADIPKLIDDVVDSAETAFNNLLPVTEQAINGLAQFVDNIAPTVVERLPGLADQVIPPLLNTANTVVTTLAKSLPQMLEGAADIAPAIVSDLAKTAVAIAPDLARTGAKVITALARGIANSAPEIVPAAKDAVIEIVDVLTEPDTVSTLLDAGIDIVIAIADGLIDGLVELDDNVPEIVDRVVEIIGDSAAKLLGAGATILHHIADGFRDEYPQFAAVVDGAANIVDEGIIPAFQGVLDFLRGDFDGGLIEISHGIEGTVSSSLGVIDGLLDTHLQQWYDETARFFEGFGAYVFNVLNPDAGEAKLSFEDALARWSDVDLGEPFDEAAAEFEALKAKGEEYRRHYSQTAQTITLLSNDANDAAKANNISLTQELERTTELTEEQLKELEKQQKAQEKAAEKALKEQEKAAEKRRKAEEKEAQARLKAQQKAEEAMTRSLEKAVSEREKLWNKYQSDVDKINSKIDDMQESYKLKLADRAKEIYSSFTLFEKVPERLQVSGQDLMQNLEDQLDRMQLFYSELDQLQAKGVSQGLVDEIRSMGVGELDNLDALLDMSDADILKYSQLYDKKVSFADAQAKAELEASKNDTLAAIEDEYAEIDKLTAENAKNTGLTFVEKLGEGIKEGFEGSTIAEMATFGLFGAYAGMSGADYMQTNYGQTEVKTRNTVSAGLAPITININGIQFQNMSELAETLGVEINKQVRRETAAYA